jgi:hypothetical protein
MKKSNQLLLIVPVIFCMDSRLTAGTYPDVSYNPPTGWDGPKFILSQSYPQSPPPDENYPWKTIDFKTKPKDYMAAVIKYCYEGNFTGGGNPELDFAPQKNTVRQWYHAPWLHYGNNGREFVHGLTTERASRPYELSATQNVGYRNFAVGFYNDKGGYALGKVWHNPSAPSTKAVNFPEGTVTFKLLFTTAPVSAVLWLNGSPEWMADINRSQNVATIKGNKVRLLQIDIAVKDARSSCGGWTFGTFHYDQAAPGTKPWEKLRPLTLLWGDDPTLTETLAHSGTKPKETWINSRSPLVKYRMTATQPQAPKVLGWAGRGNGPVDNPVSSCLSCHSTAQTPVKSRLLPTATASEQEKLRWFRNLKPNESFDAGSDSLDFSQQLSVGVQNFNDFHKLAANQGGISNEQPQATPPTGPRPAEFHATSHATPLMEFRVTRDPEE